MQDLDTAVARLRQAIDRREPILLQGDYDVDGVSATELLASTLRALGGVVHTRIPHRTRDGYGLTLGSVEDARARQCGRLRTVDCGIGAEHPVAAARELGIDAVITDHHEPGPRLPQAFAVVNPRRSDCGYPFKSLAGVGVAFKVATALYAAAGRPRDAEDLLDLVALGTIADVVPLTGENRAMVMWGLDRLSRPARPGIGALLERAGLVGRRLSSGQVAFGLAPRINAAGRVGEAEAALRLLQARDSQEAADRAAELERYNDTRREHDERAAREAMERVEHELDWPRCASILMWSEEWHPGVVGIVASRVVERFHRPTFLVALDGPLGRGSGRSVPDLDLTQVLVGCADLLETYGGHAMAAGLTVSRARLPELRSRFEAEVRARFDPEQSPMRLWLDDDLPLAECTLELCGWLARLAPFGLGNPEPVFRAQGVEVDAARTMGEGRHLRLAIRDSTGRGEAVGFGWGREAIQRGARIALAYTLERNEWMGEVSPRLLLRGIQRA